MVKKLQDLCLDCICNNLDRIDHAGMRIPTIYKECLIERLAYHDLFRPDYQSHIFHALFSSSLRHINFYKCDQISTTILSNLRDCGCQLETLTIHACSNVTDDGIQAVTKGQTKLSSIVLRKLATLTSRGLIFIKSTSLHKLDLRGCSELTNEGIDTVLGNNPSIKDLILVDNNKLDKQVFGVIAEHLRENLEELDACLRILDDDGLTAIARCCPNLLKINLCSCNRISGKGLLTLSQGCTKLQELDLSYCCKLSSLPDCESLWTLPTSLTELSLCGLLLTDETIFVESLQRLRSLKGFRLLGISALNDNTFDKILQHTGHALTMIDVSGIVNEGITDAGLASIVKYCPYIESLSLSLIRLVTCNTLAPMFKDKTRAERISKLFLSCKNINPEILHLVASSCINLEKLDMAGLSCVDDSLLINLADNCLKLKQIGLKGCTMVTDVGVCHLVRHGSLIRLGLSGVHNITDKSVFAIANSCHYLEELYLNGCSKVSKTTIRYLKDCCIMRVYVQHHTPNTVPNQLMARNLDTGDFCRADLM